MGDFLKKFSNENYDNMNKLNYSEENAEDGSSLDSQEMNIASTPHEIANPRNEVFIKDIEKIKKRRQVIIISCTCIILLIVASMFGYYKLNQISVPNFLVNKSLEEVQIWAAKNDVEIGYTLEYNNEIDEGNIVEQSVEEGVEIQKGSFVEFIVSNGADPEEHIIIPDFMGMTLIEIESWKEENKAVNVSINYEYSDEIMKSNTIRFEFKTEGIDANNYRRKDKINIIVSKGEETFEKNITVPDFSNKTRNEVDIWAEENGIQIEYIEVASEEVEENHIISQDVLAESKVAKNDVIKITISRGRVIHVPDFSSLNETQSQIIAAEKNVIINIMYYYSNEVNATQMLSQSLPAGAEVKNETIVLTYSLGKPYIDNFDGNSVYSMVEAIHEMNSKGARLTYEIKDIDSSEKKGIIINSNYKGCFVDLGSHIIIESSSGN